MASRDSHIFCFLSSSHSASLMASYSEEVASWSDVNLSVSSARQTISFLILSWSWDTREAISWHFVEIDWSCLSFFFIRLSSLLILFDSFPINSASDCISRSLILLFYRHIFMFSYKFFNFSCIVISSVEYSSASSTFRQELDQCWGEDGLDGRAAGEREVLLVCGWEGLRGKSQRYSLETPLLWWAYMVKFKMRQLDQRDQQQPMNVVRKLKSTHEENSFITAKKQTNVQSKHPLFLRLACQPSPASPAYLLLDYELRGQTVRCLMQPTSKCDHPNLPLDRTFVVWVESAPAKLLIKRRYSLKNLEGGLEAALEEYFADEMELI